MSIELRKQTEVLNNYDMRFDHMADEMKMLTKEHIMRMSTVEKVEDEVMAAIDQISTFKEKVTDLITEKIESIEVEIYGLQAPQVEMNRKINHNI